MSAILLTNPIAVKNALAEKFGLTREQLLEVAFAMQRARNGCTANDAPMAPGVKAWLDGTRCLRDLLLPLGWVKDDTNGVPSCRHPELGIRISVANTDDGTGDPDQIPVNCSRKGMETRRIVSETQGLICSVMDNGRNIVALTPQSNAALISGHWFFCVFSDGDTMRAELTCPIDCSGGWFSDFNDRILVTDEDGDDGLKVTRATPDAPLEFEIPVTRKEA